MKNSSELFAWLVNNLDIPFKRYDIFEIKKDTHMVTELRLLD